MFEVRYFYKGVSTSIIVNSGLDTFRLLDLLKDLNIDAIIIDTKTNEIVKRQFIDK